MGAGRAGALHVKQGRDKFVLRHLKGGSHRPFCRPDRHHRPIRTQSQPGARDRCHDRLSVKRRPETPPGFPGKAPNSPHEWAQDAAGGEGGGDLLPRLQQGTPPHSGAVTGGGDHFTAFAADWAGLFVSLQHKNEAKAFYALLSQGEAPIRPALRPLVPVTPRCRLTCPSPPSLPVYDYVVNPGHWTTDMREDALQPAQLNNPDLKVQRGRLDHAA